MRPSREQNLHVDILEIISSGASLGGDAQATLETFLMATRAPTRQIIPGQLGRVAHDDTQTQEVR